MHQYWGLSESRSKEQIKFKLLTGRESSCMMHVSVGGQQLARDCSCIRSSLTGVCETAETKVPAAQALPPGLLLAQLMLCIPFLASPVICERTVPAKDADLFPSSEEGGLWHDLTQAGRVPVRENPSTKPFGMDFKVSSLSETWQGPLLSSSVSIRI